MPRGELTVKKPLMLVLILSLFLMIISVSANVSIYTIKTNDLIINFYCNSKSSLGGHYITISSSKGKINIYNCEDINVLVHEMAHHYCWVTNKDLSHSECFRDECNRLGGKEYCDYYE